MPVAVQEALTEEHSSLMYPDIPQFLDFTLYVSGHQCSIPVFYHRQAGLVSKLQALELCVFSGIGSHQDWAGASLFQKDSRTNRRELGV